MELLLLAFAPGLSIALYIYLRDRYEREPFKAIALTFALGAVGAIVAAFLEAAFPYQANSATALATAANATLVVAPIEETAKFFAVWLLVYRAPVFNEPFDGVVYCVIASMGFATLENLMYVLGGGMHVAIERAFVSVPGHAAFGAIMGYYVGRARFDTGPKHRWLLLQGLLYATIAHGLFDFGLLSRTGWGIACTAVTFIAALIIGFVAIRASSNESGAFWARQEMPS
jgi:RsiW-degrading membrane proteinase PrsW (M82 family)